VKDHHAQPAGETRALSARVGAATTTTTSSPDELASTLREVAGELRAIREMLKKRQPSSPEEPRRV
jgi:hypothetical protein